MAGNLYSFRVDATHLGRKLAALEHQAQEARRVVRAVNQRSVEWLGERAAENLSPRIRRAHDFRNDVSLLAMVVNRNASVISANGFRFLDDEKVQKLTTRAWHYYRAVEYGSDYWVRETATRRFGLLFYGPGGNRGQAGVGSWVNAKFPQVHITHPVPAYHYALQARDAFVQSRLWWRWAYADLQAAGIENVRATR